MGKLLLTDAQVQQVIAAATQSAVDLILADGYQADSDAESDIEIWAGHFTDHHLVSDHIIANFLARQDTSTAMFEQQLEALLSKTYDKKYPALKARQMVPEGPGIPSGAETVSSYGFDEKGEATLLASYGEDIRRVDLDGVKSTWNIIGIAASWALTIQQARAAAMSGVPIDAKGLMAARRMVERKIDSLIALGDSKFRIDGFAALTTGSSGVYLENKTGDLTGDWITATADNIRADLDICVANFSDGNIWEPTHLLLPTDLYARFRSLRIATGSDYTLLKWIEDQYELAVEKWSVLNTADSAGTGGRAILYVRDEEVVSSIVSQEPEQLPSVWTGLGWDTVMHARCGGVRVENPRGILYADQAV